jgi:hypothetical protein
MRQLSTLHSCEPMYYLQIVLKAPGWLKLMQTSSNQGGAKNIPSQLYYAGLSSSSEKDL